MLQAETEPDEMSIGSCEVEMAAATAPTTLYPDLNDDDNTMHTDEPAGAAASSPLQLSSGEDGEDETDKLLDSGSYQPATPTAPPNEDSLTSDETASARSTEL